MTALADASTLFSPKRPRSNRPFPYAFLPWDMRASGVPADGADPDLVRKAVEGGVCAKRLSASLRDSPAALQNLGLACGGVLTNAAALLFAESTLSMLQTIATVSYTHLTLPTICSV